MYATQKRIFALHAFLEIEEQYARSLDDDFRYSEAFDALEAELGTDACRALVNITVHWTAGNYSQALSSHAGTRDVLRQLPSPDLRTRRRTSSPQPRPAANSRSAGGGGQLASWTRKSRSGDVSVQIVG